MKIVNGVFYYKDKDNNEQWIEIGKTETQPEFYLNPKWHPQMAKIIKFTKIDDNHVILHTGDGKYRFVDFLTPNQSVIIKIEEK